MRKVILACGILFGFGILFLSFFAFRFKNLVNSFLTPSRERVNILILGKGGVGHEAPDLTDTIILASFDQKKISLISLPRDIWVPEIRAKLNSAYYWGKQKGVGFELVDKSVETITGLKTDYNLVIDFSGFKKIIDALGGIEVEVKNAFVDEKYPIAGKENDPCLPCRYETVRFSAGKQKMDGETALKFVRSRNAAGEEGTDLAREARQQLVIEAIKNELIKHPLKILLLKEVVLESIETDMTRDSLAEISGMALRARENLVLNSLPEEFLRHPPISPKYDRQYVFIPKDGNWERVKAWILSSL